MTRELSPDSRLPQQPGQVPGQPLALYVHVPFCLSICPWCDFVVYGGAAARGPRSQVAAYLAAVHAELDLRADALDARWPRRPPLGSVYLGGGTPSLLPSDAVAALLEHMRRRFGVEHGAEITLEANPGGDDRGDLAGFAAAGVNRLSFGLQSMDAAELRSLGRRHQPPDAAAAVTEARAAGVRSVNLDLLYDVPGGSLTTWAQTLRAALALEPDHLSLYALTLDDSEAEGRGGPAGDHLPVSAGARRWRMAAADRQDEERAAAQYAMAVDCLAAAGWHGYEISNWARTGHESRHNLAYWQRRPFEAVGPGAHAFDGQVRRWNAARLDGYLAALLPGSSGRPSLPPGGEERLDTRTEASETAILALRTDCGIRRADAVGKLAEPLDWGLANGLLERLPGDRLALTTRGRLLSNELFVRLL